MAMMPTREQGGRPVCCLCLYESTIRLVVGVYLCRERVESGVCTCAVGDQRPAIGLVVTGRCDTCDVRVGLGRGCDT